MRLDLISPEGIAPGLPFAPAVRVEGATRLLLVSGQMGEDASGELVSADAGEQAEQCLRNIDLILRDAGAERTDVAKLTVYLTDVADREAVAAARTAFFGEHRPATTGLVVAGLVAPGARVEIEAIAVF